MHLFLNREVNLSLYSDTGVIIGLKIKLNKMEKKIKQLEQQLCPKCKETFIEIFEDSQK